MTHRTPIIALLSLVIFCCCLNSAHASPYVERLGSYLSPYWIAQGSQVRAYSADFSRGGRGSIFIDDLQSDATIRQVLIYWMGASNCFENARVSNLQIANSNWNYNNRYSSVTGVNIGQSQVTRNDFRAAFRADLTALRLIQPGIDNRLEIVAGRSFNRIVTGAIVYVISDQGSGRGNVYISEGLDTASQMLRPPYDTTLPVVFNVTAAARPRRVRLLLGISGTFKFDGKLAPSSVEIKIDGCPLAGSPFSNRLGEAHRENWDTLVFDFELPAGARSVSVKVFSRDDAATGRTPAVINWVNAILSVERAAIECTIQPIPALACAGPLTNIHLDGSGSFDPNSWGNPALNYVWRSDCVGGYFTGGNSGPHAVLALTQPGNRYNPQPQVCNVYLTTTSRYDYEEANCSAAIYVPACVHDVDCQGVPNGPARPDLCGVCNGYNSTCRDCAGIPNGHTTYDLCGVCGGDNRSCRDCTGVINGGSVRDRCGVCNGNNACLTRYCAEQNISTSVATIDNTRTSEEQNVRRLILSLQRSVCRKDAAARRLIKKAKTVIDSLSVSNDQALQTIPARIRSCPGVAGCRSINTGASTAMLARNSSRLYGMAVSLAKARISCRSSGRCNGSSAACHTRFVKRRAETYSDTKLARSLHRGVAVNTQAIPAQASQCNF